MRSTFVSLLAGCLLGLVVCGGCGKADQVQAPTNPAPPPKNPSFTSPGPPPPPSPSPGANEAKKDSSTRRAAPPPPLKKSRPK
jgi:hypothetical protein